MFGNLVDNGDGIQVVGNVGTSVSVDGASITSRGAQGILIVNNSPSTGSEVINFTNTTITGASAAGVLIQKSTVTTTFGNLNIDLDEPSAVGFQAIDSGAIFSNFNNSVATTSTTAPAVSIVNTGLIAMTFNNVSSAVPAGTNAAMDFTNSNGSFDVLSQFLVSGTAGTEAADVSPVPPPVTVTLPPP